MVKINLIGQLFGQTGYAIHTRNLFNAMVKEEPEIKLDVPLIQGWELHVNDAELSAITRERYDDGINIFIGLPPFWSLGMVEPHKAFIGCVVWEGDKVPDSFIKNMLKADHLICPSTHVRDAILNTTDKVKDKITVVPHGVDSDLFVPQKKKTEKFVFVANKGWADGLRDRGGLQYLFRAFSEEFGKDEPVELLVKINGAYCRPGWDLGNELAQLNMPADRPLIHISTDNVEYKDIPRFYAGDCFVSPTMGEAFSIPCLEAMSCGLPVIATDFGGQTDFISDGWLFNSTLKLNEWHYEYEGIGWAHPDVSALKRIMRDVFDVGVSEETRKSCRDTAKKWSWDSAAKKLLRLCNDLEEKS